MRPTHRLSSCCRTALAAAALLGAARVSAQPARQEAPQDIDKLAELSLEELMSIDVTSVAGVGENWFRTPAAMYVITGEEIRRSGHRSIAEALRLAPGVFVGRSDSNTWSVGMRGFNGGLANKTLVLIDGRSVYDPLFSGTFWDIQDTLLEDIDRIEVIRGPGATLWGANAVNGVINVITKSAKETQGLLFNGGAGTEELGFGAVRYGHQVADNAWVRVYAKYFQRDDFKLASGASAGDDWDMLRGGFRFDLDGTDDVWLTMQGDLYQSDRIGETTSDGRAAGGNLLFRIGRQPAGGAGWTLQAYYDRTERLAAGSALDVDRHTFDVDFRHHLPVGDRHQIIWGLDFRDTSDTTTGSGVTTFVPPARDSRCYSAFVQDTITLVPDRLFSMIGTKLEHNDHTGFEVQPSARLWWTPDDRQTIWASISRAVRVPSRLEDDAVISVPVPPSVVLGDPTVDSEELIAYEAGYRRKVTERLTVDLAAFFNDYENFLFIPTAPPLVFNNAGSAETYGGEVAVGWRPADNWRLEGSYSYVQVQVHGPIANTDEGRTPHNILRLQSYLDVTDDLEFNAGLSYVDSVSVPTRSVRPYWRLDLGVTWHVTRNFDIALWGQNLLEPTHPEFSAVEVQRGAYLMGTLRF